ncbi:MAG TPA: hypothetical protein DCZ71_04585 [Ruminococcus sp.]|nr:hypothetical protein [Ruminococcus sp.]
MKERIAKLIDVKTLVTFTLTGAFTYLAVCGEIDPQIFMSVYAMVIGFYFGTQREKSKKEGNDND